MKHTSKNRTFAITLSMLMLFSVMFAAAPVAKAEAEPDGVSFIDVPEQISVGSEYYIVAELVYEGVSEDDYIKWECEGQEKDGTTISDKGKLTVASDETAASITVTATSSEDDTKYAVQDIIIVAKKVFSVSIENAPSSMLQGSSATLKAMVVAHAGTDSTVKWRMFGAQEEGTAINALTGEPTIELTIDDDEAIDTALKVVAYSAYDNSIMDSISIKVTAITGVEITDYPTTISKGSSYALKATVTGEGSFDESVVWSLSGDYVSGTKVDASTGKLTVAAGETADSIEVIAQSKDDSIQATKQLAVVEDKVAKVELTTPSSIKPGDTKQLEATLTLNSDSDTTTDKSIVWILSGQQKSGTTLTTKGVLVIDDEEAIGTALSVKVMSVYDNSRFDTKEIVISNPSISQVQITAPTAPLARGDQLKLEATVTASDNADKSLTWSVSGNSSSSTRLEGATLYISPDEDSGKLTITATSSTDNTKSDSCTVDIKQVTAVSISPQAASAKVGETMQFSATVTQTHSADTSVNWSVGGNNSSDTKIDSNGLLTIAGNETSTSLQVTVTSIYNSSKKASATVTVGGQNVGWKQADDSGTAKWYYYNTDGTLATGWKLVGGVWYYMNSNGVMQTGWKNVSGTWYFLRSSGAMATGWYNDNGTWYFLKPSGAMQTGWLKTGSQWYYLRGSGAMVTGWYKVDSTWYFLESSGAMRTGWLLSGSKWYYLNDSGAMVTGQHVVGSKTYRFDSSGAMLK